MLSRRIAAPAHFPPHRDFKNISVQELLEVRDAWHIPLTNMHNVVGTAIGRYRFRRDQAGRVEPRTEATKPKTFEDSIVDGRSFACILVLVSESTALGQFDDDDPAKPDRQHIVPEFLYAGDLVVPTCVVRVFLNMDEDPGASLAELAYPDDLYGGGRPLVISVQRQQHVATAGCLVTDGERRYVLTAGHFAGAAGQEVLVSVRGELERIGQTSGKQARGVPFKTLYPSWNCGNAQCSLDAGLVEVDDAERWTSQIYGIGPVDAAAELYGSTITLGLIGQPLVAYGARSQRMEGEICGLFPRYRATAGVDSLADLLIGPRSGQARKGGGVFRVQPGDSGALWVVPPGAPGERVRPVALNWASLDLVGSTGVVNFALATLVNNISRVLDVDVVTDHNTGFAPVWGKANHQAIADILCQAMDRMRPGNALAEFLLAGGVDEATEMYKELAYTPDAWKMTKGRGYEKPNHYANLDLPGGGQELKDIALTPAAWLAFYKDSDDAGNRGAIPFRVRQVVALMKEMTAPAEFVCAAGLLMHYAADVANPAHGSWWGRGNPSWDGDSRSKFHAVWDNAKIDEDGAIATVAQAMQRVQQAVIDPAVDTLAVMEEIHDTISVHDFVAKRSAAQGIKKAREFCKTADGQQAVTECAVLGASFWWRLVSDAWANGRVTKDRAWGAATDVTSVCDNPAFLPSIGLEKLAEEEAPA